MSTRARILACCSLLVLVCSATFATSPADDSSFTALTEGNRLFRDGHLDAAVEAYLRGTTANGPAHPTLLYNLGAALHHLDRLPEAILWYRRAEGSRDPWLEENLFLARRSLGSQSLPPGGAWQWLLDCRPFLTPAAIACGWLSVVFVFGSRRLVGVALLSGSVTLFGLAAALDYFGPHQAVVLTDCSTAVGDLPAGTEAWVRFDSQGHWTISGSKDTYCPPQSIELIDR